MSRENIHTLAAPGRGRKEGPVATRFSPVDRTKLIATASGRGGERRADGRPPEATRRAFRREFPGIHDRREVALREKPLPRGTEIWTMSDDYPSYRRPYARSSRRSRSRLASDMGANGRRTSSLSIFFIMARAVFTGVGFVSKKTAWQMGSIR